MTAFKNLTTELATFFTQLERDLAKAATIAKALGTPQTKQPAKRSYVRSAAARRRMARAQKARWAKHRQQAKAKR